MTPKHTDGRGFCGWFSAEFFLQSRALSGSASTSARLSAGASTRLSAGASARLSASAEVEGLVLNELAPRVSTAAASQPPLNAPSAWNGLVVFRAKSEGVF